MSHLDYYDNAKNKTVMDMVVEFSTVTNQHPNPVLYEKLIAEEYDEWSKEVLDAHNELKELSDLVYVCYGYANAMGWDLNEAIRRVHANNVGRCLQPDGTVHRRDDGKILKNPEYPKVDLKDLL
jgi:predicted HAD superfamily Cof-like phosphohydrolase